MTAWLLLGAVVLAQIGYPLADGDLRTGLVLLTVVLGFAFSLNHAAATRGLRAAVALILVTTLGGLLVESVGVATGFPFGRYEYDTALGPTLLGVPLVIPLAWSWMAWPAWVVSGHLVPAGPTVARVVVAGMALAAWDLFLDPQMVAAGYWNWTAPGPGLPGVPAVPSSNYLAWLGVALVMMASFAALMRRQGRGDAHSDGPALALYGWTYASSTLAHAAFLGLPASALWGGVGMGLVAVPLAVTVARRRSGRHDHRTSYPNGRETTPIGGRRPRVRGGA